MFHDAIHQQPVQDDRPVAAHLRAHLTQFVRPIMTKLAQQIDIRLVQTARDLVQVILTHRHRAMGLLLSELGGYLLGPAQAPAGTKRISNLVHAASWSADDINAAFWKQATERVQTLNEQRDAVLAVWDGSVWEKPESQAGEDWCPVRSAKARRLARRRKGISLPHTGPPILVPGLHWDGIAVLGMRGAPTLAHLEWWTTRGPHATTQREVEQRLLSRCAEAWGQDVCHIWDRGYAGSPWVQAAITANVRFVVRWKKGNKLLDNWGEARKAWEIARGKRSQDYRMPRDPATKQLIKAGVVAIPVTLLDHPQPLWLVVARLGAGREPWYLLSNDPICTRADAWAVVLAYAQVANRRGLAGEQKRVGIRKPPGAGLGGAAKAVAVGIGGVCVPAASALAILRYSACLSAAELVPSHRDAVSGGGGAALSAAFGPQPALASGATTGLPSTSVKFGMTHDTPDQCGEPLDTLRVAQRIAEERQPIALAPPGLAGPARVLLGQDRVFGVRHQPEHVAGRVADAGDRVVGAVRVGRVRGRAAVARDVAQRQLAARPQRRQRRAVARHEAALAVGHRHLDRALDPTREYTAAARVGREVHPAALEAAGLVIRQGR